MRETFLLQFRQSCRFDTCNLMIHKTSRCHTMPRFPRRMATRPSDFSYMGERERCGREKCAAPTRSQAAAGPACRAPDRGRSRIFRGHRRNRTAALDPAADTAPPQWRSKRRRFAGTAIDSGRNVTHLAFGLIHPPPRMTFSPSRVWRMRSRRRPANSPSPTATGVSARILVVSVHGFRSLLRRPPTSRICCR